MERVLIVSSVLLWMVVLTNLLLTLALIRQRNTEPVSQGQRKDFGGPPVGQSAPDFTAETLVHGRVKAYAVSSTMAGPCRST